MLFKVFADYFFSQTNIQNDDVSGTYLVKTNFVLLTIDKVADDDNGKDASDFKEQDQLSYESSSDVGLNHDANTQLIKFDYHVLYHINYGVPYLCFNAHKSSRLNTLSLIIFFCISKYFMLFF